MLPRAPTREHQEDPCLPGHDEQQDERHRIDEERRPLSAEERDGVCRSGSGGATHREPSGGWSIQELETGRTNPIVLLDSQGRQPVPIQDVNRIEVTCTGSASGPATLSLSVNGTEVPSVTDDTPLPAGSVGMAVAGRPPTG